LKELFNHAHSSLRNVIERSFGVLKMKWRILLKMPSYLMEKQSKIIIACMALHNFIRDSNLSDNDFDTLASDETYVDGMRELLLVMLVMSKIWMMYEMLLRKHLLEDIDNGICAKNDVMTLYYLIYNYVI
jgi:hypothetical protein